VDKVYKDMSEEEAGSNRNNIGTVGKQKERRRRIGTGSGKVRSARKKTGQSQDRGRRK